MKGAITCIVKPPENGDFNNLLQSCGDQSIRDIIEPEITKLTKAVETTKLTQTENNRPLSKLVKVVQNYNKLNLRLNLLRLFRYLSAVILNYFN
ncbi:hypothetical protein ACA351_04250 [Orientia tsutsugamushi]|uniref:hypothetical protein n=1 Tax=Orientia tsutsugamushi TaxID=784 RepID=UPI003528B805